MASIRASGAYNSPDMAQAAQNIAAMFGPPSASELAGYSTARLNNQKADYRTQLVQMAQSPDFNQQIFDRTGMAMEAWAPNQSHWSVEQNNATQRYGYDTQAATQRANNLEDNRTDLIETLYGSRDPYHNQPALPADIASSFSLPEIPAMPGQPKPLSETEVKGGWLQELKGNGDLSTDDIIALTTSSARPSAAEQQIARLAENFMATGTVQDPAEARNLAVGIVDGRYKTDQHPITGELQIIDLATGQPVNSAAPPSPVPNVDDQIMGAVTGEDPFGAPYPDASGSFGLGGALAGTINRTMDAVGLGAPYPDVQRTQAAFGVLRENLLNDIAETYGRQPPSWLLQDIRSLTPEAGNLLEGPEAAQAKLTAIGRQLQSQIEQTQESLGRQNSPSGQQELETRLGGLQTGLSRVQEALAAFGPRGGGQTGQAPADDVPEGIDPADWQYMTEAERALFR